MAHGNIGAVIEAILFVSGDPVRVEDLAHAMNLTASEMSEALDALADHLSLENRGIQLNRNGESVFLSIRPALAPQVEAFLQPLQKRPLSQAVLETLSIIAYRQPCTRGDIEAIRGVKCDYSVQSLLNKGFIEECGPARDARPADAVPHDRRVFAALRHRVARRAAQRRSESARGRNRRVTNGAADLPTTKGRLSSGGAWIEIHQTANTSNGTVGRSPPGSVD